MVKRFTETDKWKDDWFISLTLLEKMFWLYLLDDCDHAGIWKGSKRMFELINQVKIDVDEMAKVFGDKIVVLENGKWLLKDFIPLQYKNSILNSANSVHKSVIDLLKINGIEISPYIEPVKTLSSPSVGGKDKDKDKDKDKGKDKGKDNDKKLLNDSGTGANISKGIELAYEKWKSLKGTAKYERKSTAISKANKIIKTQAHLELLDTAIDNYFKSIGDNRDREGNLYCTVFHKWVEDYEDHAKETEETKKSKEFWAQAEANQNSDVDIFKGLDL